MFSGISLHNDTCKPKTVLQCIAVASDFTKVRKAFEVHSEGESTRQSRIVEPAMALGVTHHMANHMLAETRVWLPAVGSKLVNRYGLEFEVESHVKVPTANSIQRWREGDQSDADLFPSIIPQNLSEELESFVAAVDRCTTKTLLVLDTMPHVRRDAGVPDGHWVDTIGNGGANLLFIDAARIHETHFAHEIGHLWVQYVEQAEDERVMDDVSDVGRLHQFSFVQSFVTDLRVNQVIAEKGFDISVIIEDQAASIASLGRAIEAGYRPENPREGVFMALALAAQILEDRKSGASELAELDHTLEKVTRIEPALARLAIGFADAVTRNGYNGKQHIRASIDECLMLEFEYSGDGIDLDRDLVIPSATDPEFDKYPQWLYGASPQMKREVGRIMAKEEIPDGSKWSIAHGPLNTVLLTFELPDGTIKGPWTLEYSQAAVEQIADIQRVNEKNRENRERQMKQQPPPGIPNFPGQPRRFYMAGTARFLTRVRESEWLDGEHPYAYAMNSPAMYTDPSGLTPESDCKKKMESSRQVACKVFGTEKGRKCAQKCIQDCWGDADWKRFNCLRKWCSVGTIVVKPANDTECCRPSRPCGYAIKGAGSSCSLNICLDSCQGSSFCNTEGERRDTVLHEALHCCETSAEARMTTEIKTNCTSRCIRKCVP